MLPSISSSSSLPFLFLFFLLFLLPPPSTPVPSTPVPSTPPSSPSPPPHGLVSPEITTPAANQRPHKTGKDEEQGGGGGGGGEEGEEDSNKIQMKEDVNGSLLVVKHFYLWTRKNPGNSSYQLLDPYRTKTISDSFFRPRKTYIIIHGFIGWGTEAWILQLKDKLLAISDSNVISVDWPAGSEWFLPGYYLAVGRVPKVGKDLTALLRGLVSEWKLDLGEVHLIGHSLGAHAAGLAAAPLSTVGRISGLDPAGLMFHKVPPSQRLDPSDAEYVDVIHTNGCTTLTVWLNCYGINENLGHSDFWPNGGRHQPACGTRKEGMSNGEIGCSHEMAYVYFIESLDYSLNQTYFLARPCSSWDDFSGGKCGCGRETQYMGFLVNTRLRGTFYLQTNSTNPFAEQDKACRPGNALVSTSRPLPFPPRALVLPEITAPATNEGPHKTGKDEGEEEEGEGDSSKSLTKKKTKEELLVVEHFYLWTRKNPGDSSYQLLDPYHNKTISDSYFRPRKTYVIIHGFLGWGTEAWILQLKNKLLAMSNSNVISVDWPAGSEWFLPFYYVAVGRVPNVGKDLTALLRGLVSEWKLDLGEVHLIGHSLGAHAAGLAAAPLSTVGRISGLDPAGLTYHNVSASERLDPSDADYVDVIHTNGCSTLNVWLDCYGINENLGHSDFWPNGGRHQPACGTRKKGMSNVSGEIGCSHQMAYVYFIESLNYNVDQTYFLARPCSSWDDFSGGKCGCGWETQYMGFSVNMRLHGTFYLHTNSTKPFAVQDGACLPGSATGSGVRIIELALISSSALIATGAGIGAIVQQVARRRSAARREEGGSSGGDGGGESSGGGGGDAVVEVSDSEALLA